MPRLDDSTRDEVVRLLQAGGRSDRSIAQQLSVDHTTVGKIRRDLESAGQLAPPPEPAPPPPDPTPPPSPPEDADAPETPRPLRVPTFDGPPDSPVARAAREIQERVEAVAHELGYGGGGGGDDGGAVQWPAIPPPEDVILTEIRGPDGRRIKVLKQTMQTPLYWHDFHEKLVNRGSTELEFNDWVWSCMAALWGGIAGAYTAIVKRAPREDEEARSA